MADFSPDALLDHLDSDLSIWESEFICDRTTSYMVPKQFAASALRTSLLKKFMNRKAKDADDKALAKFIECNRRCGYYTIPNGYSRDELAVVFGEFGRLLHDFFMQYSSATNCHVEAITEDNILENARHGPGSSRYAQGEHSYFKSYASEHSTTDTSLGEIYNNSLPVGSTEHKAEKERQRVFGKVRVTQGSKLSFADKYAVISRTICTEPLLNMYFQQGIGGTIENLLLRKYGIDFDGNAEFNRPSQAERNRVLAKIGSISGRFGTIDLESASDTISLKLLSLLPPVTRGWIQATRSEATVLPNGKSLRLDMVSSMGNGFTFPLMTALFVCLVHAVYKVKGVRLCRPSGSDNGNFGVFGDDIIVERECYDLTVECLELLGFKVNLAKSFNAGPFRESCGHDYYCGYHVRGVYFKRHRQMQDLYSLFNRLTVWSARHDIALGNTLRYVLGNLRYNPVPPWAPESAGVQVPSICLPHPLRFAPDLHGSILYYADTPKADVLNVSKLGDRPCTEIVRKVYAKSRGKKTLKTKRYAYNPHGIVLSAVSGTLRRGNISFRQQTPHYQRRVAIAPCWDYLDAYHPLMVDDGLRRWETILRMLTSTSSW